MNTKEISKKYDVRKLHTTDIQTIYELMNGNPLYFQYCPPRATYQSIEKDMQSLPPKKGIDDKYYIGYFCDGELIAVMDVILNYPNDQTVFIGFFMMNKNFQGNGIGTEIISEAQEYFKTCGYSYIRLAFAKGNPQSEAFWLKNGFEKTGLEVQNEGYIAVVMQKVI